MVLLVIESGAATAQSESSADIHRALLVFGGKFWQPSAMSENLRGLRFSKGVQRFIYRRTTTATSAGDVTRPIATEDHNGNGRMVSSAHGYYDPYIYSVIVK
jgi:hypothetical protein